MRLIDLEPRWLTPNLFIFRNPTGGNDWLTCKNVVMSMSEQHNLIEQFPEYPAHNVAPCKPKVCWSFSTNDFETITVHPSIDGSPSGNWHGFIKGGEIQ